MRTRLRYLLAAAAGVGTVGLLGGCGRSGSGNGSEAFEVREVAKSSPLNRMWQVPAFQLTDQRGMSFDASLLKGKVWVVDFFYSSCAGPCPMLTSRLSEIHRKFAGTSGVGFLSISSDPEKDTPEVLAKYAEKFGADERWFFLTGDKAAVYRLANEGFKLSLTEVLGAPEPITHSTKLVLMDSEGWVRGVYEGVGDSSLKASEKLVADIRVLCRETEK
jgi:protein SCO1/2